MSEEEQPNRRELEKPPVRVEVFSQGKTPERNEDYATHTDDAFVLADGATDKSGKIYEGKTGGEIVAQVIAQETLRSNLNGAELIEHLNNVVRATYEKLGLQGYVQEPKLRFTASFVVARATGDKTIVTSTGDVGMRINGKDLYQDKKEIDRINAEARATYIQETGDIQGGRAHIMPGLFKQFEYQNNPDHPLGYGVIDGTNTPAKFIQTYEFERKDTETIELFTDGYFEIPKGTTVEDWEQVYQEVEQEDPEKYLKYKSTKSKDDRTVMIIQLNSAKAAAN